MHCPNCGRPVAPGGLACGHCGAAIVPPHLAPRYGPPQWHKVSALRPPLIALLGIEAVLALLLHVKWYAPLAFLMVFAATAVLFIAWLYRARRNAVGGKHQFGPPWAVAGWFVPLASAYIPMRVVLDTGRASTPPGRRTSVTVLVVGWWALLLVSFLTGTREITAARDESVSFIGTPGSTWVSAVCLAMSAVVLAVVVHRITVDQERAFRPR